MKNQFKKHLSVFVKNTALRVIIERVGDFYYISDSYTMLRLPAVYYAVMARPVSPLFVELQENTHARRNPGEMLPEVQSGHASLAAIWERTKADQGATVTRLSYDDQDDKKRLRYVITGGRPVVYNDAYIMAAFEYCGGFSATADRFPVLKYDGKDGTGCIIMPVNSLSAREALSDLIGVVK